MNTNVGHATSTHLAEGVVIRESRVFVDPDFTNGEPTLNDTEVAFFKENGFLIFEFGMGQAEAVAGLIRSTPGLRMVGFKRDLQGVPRTAIVRSSRA